MKRVNAKPYALLRSIFTPAHNLLFPTRTAWLIETKQKMYSFAFVSVIDFSWARVKN